MRQKKSVTDVDSEPIEEATSVSDFLKSIEELKDLEELAGNGTDFIFRGQRADDPLLPRIARLDPKGELLNVERLMLEDFKRQMVPFTDKEPRDDWDVLALAQHHGLPTRLLDWSYSSLAALWFCVERGPKKSKEGELLDGVVWVFKTEVQDFISPAEKEGPFDQGRTRIFRPRFISRRIMAQAGLFTCHKWLTKGGFGRLEHNAKYKDRLVKIRIPASQFASVREQLVASGVSSLVLFPDLGGLAAHLEQRYFH